MSGTRSSSRRSGPPCQLYVRQLLVSVDVNTTVLDDAPKTFELTLGQPRITPEKHPANVYSSNTERLGTEASASDAGLRRPPRAARF